MSAPAALFTSNLVYGLAVIPVAVLLVHFVPYLLDPHGIRAYPGPFLARLSDIWLGWIAAQGHRSETVHELHKQYGTFVRIAPNHVSISDPEAIQYVYAHGNGTTKSNFYDAFVSIRRGLFNTRSRPEHARKRKIVSHIFSMKSVMEFEPYTRLHVAQLLKQWDRLYELGIKGASGEEGEGWKGRDGRVWLDCLPWYNYLAFDIIGACSTARAGSGADRCYSRPQATWHSVHRSACSTPAQMLRPSPPSTRTPWRRTARTTPPR